QSMEANFVAINPESAVHVPWKSIALRRARLARMLTRVLFFSGMLVAVLALLVWLGAYGMANMLTREREKARQVSADATNQLMINAANALQSNTDQSLARVIELLNTTSSFGGVLTRYEVKDDGSVEWEALIPSAVSPGQL